MIVEIPLKEFEGKESHSSPEIDWNMHILACSKFYIY